MRNCISLRRLAGFAFVLASTTYVTSDCSLAQPRVADAHQNPSAPSSGTVVVDETQSRLEMIINSSQILKTNGDIARANVQNDSLVDVKPISRNQMLVSAKATGFTQVDLYAPDGSVRNVQITVLADARELASILRSEFPSSTITVRPIQNAVILSGSVTSDLHVAAAVQIAQQYYPNVVNRIEVLGVHTVQLHVQIMEVSRTKLRNAGVDWALGFGNDFVQQTTSGLLNPGGTPGSVNPAGNETFKFGVVDGGNSFFAYLNLLKRDNLVKVLADPTLTAVDGRPASFNSGGEFPVLVPAGLGQVGVEFREFGTRLDFVAKVRGDGLIHLEVRPMISEVDETRAVTINGISVPGLRSRYVETGVDMLAGQTLAIAGLLQVRTEATATGIPWLSDMPYLGFMFRNVREQQNEVELLITVTPDFAAGMDPSDLPTSYPGFNTMSPSDKELYWKGHIEVPNLCNDNCQTNGVTGGPGSVMLMDTSGAQSSNSKGSQQHFSPDVSQQNFGSLRSEPARPVSYSRSEGMLPPPSAQLQQASQVR